jgi:hypothetical protein
MGADFEVRGDNSDALFTLTVRRGEGMALLSMDWKKGRPSDDFVGFAIECKPPGENRFFPLENRLSFSAADGSVEPARRSTKLSPLQKFRWLHFPRDAEVDGEFEYRVSPVFMNDEEELRYGETQSASIALGGETYPGKLNVSFTRGFVSSQAFVEHYAPTGDISTLIPEDAHKGLEFEPTHPQADEALDWMGFEARRAILEVLDRAIADQDAKVKVVAYDLSQPDILSRLKRLGPRLKAIVDDSGEHKPDSSPETRAANQLMKSAGEANVKRQHMDNLQHNKTIVVDGPKGKAVVCGSTNYTWRGFFVQANNAVILHGDKPTEAFLKAFGDYWDHDDAEEFGATPSADLADLGLSGIDAKVAFSPHTEDNALLTTVAEDIAEGSESSVLYSLAFLAQTKGAVTEAIKKVTSDEDIFVYGSADAKVQGILLQEPSGNVAPVFAAALPEDVPEPFKSEPKADEGRRMHHKFVVIDFDKPTARVYTGSYNFSGPADTENGENLLVIKDRRIAVAYAIEALRIFDHYHFRVVAQKAKDKGEPLVLTKPPRNDDEKPWWDKYYTDPPHIRDREVFA